MLNVIDKDRQLIYSGIVFFICYVLLAVIALHPVYAYDTFWHLQMGKDLVEHGLSPWVDHYSFSYLGSTITSVPVIFQVVLYKFVALFGEQQGFYYIKLFYITLVMAVLWLYFRKIKAPVLVVFVLLPIISSAISLRLIIRPEIFSNVLVVLCLLLYLQAQKEFSVKSLVLILVLLVFWSLYHSPVIGNVIIFGLFLEKAINKIFRGEDGFSWAFFSFWAIAVFLSGFVDLSGKYLIGQHFVITMITSMSEGFGGYINEYKSAYQFNSANVITHISWVMSLYVAIWSLIKKQFGFLFIVVILTLLSWSMARLLAVVFLINICVFSFYITQFNYSGHVHSIRLSVKKTLVAVSVIISLLGLYYLGEKAYASVQIIKNRESVLESRYPVQVVDFLKYYQDGGNILNIMQYGGYLINKLSPDFKVYYDGRTSILYPIDFVEHNDQLWASVKKVDDVVTQYDISYVLRKNTTEIYGSLHKSRQFNLAFADDNYLLFSTKTDNVFPIASMLLSSPLCWQEGLVPEVQNEIKLSASLFGNSNYTLKSALAFMQEYLDQNDKKKYFAELKFDRLRSDSIRRMAFILAMEDADEVTISQYFSSIKVKSYYDILIYSYYLTSKKQYDTAEKLAYFFYSREKSKAKEIQFDKAIMLVHILDNINERSSMKLFTHAQLDEFYGILKAISYAPGKELSFDYLCH